MWGGKHSLSANHKGLGLCGHRQWREKMTRLDRAERPQNVSLCTMLKALNSSRRLQETMERCSMGEWLDCICLEK